MHMLSLASHWPNPGRVATRFPRSYKPIRCRATSQSRVDSLNKVRRGLVIRGTIFWLHASDKQDVLQAFNSHRETWSLRKETKCFCHIIIRKESKKNTWKNTLKMIMVWTETGSVVDLSLKHFQLWKGEQKTAITAKILPVGKQSTY